MILLGAPGVGKGTQAKLISKHFKIPHLSTGDMFRENISNRTPLGLHAESYIKKGQLVPDDITISLVRNSLNENKCKSGFLLDGFPRNLYQAKELHTLLSKQNKSIDTVILIDIPKEIIIKRLSNRRICAKCGCSYQINPVSSTINHLCQQCGGNLIQREDDREDVILTRLCIYNNLIKPVVDYYTVQGVLHKINGNDSVDSVFSNICSLLSSSKDSFKLEGYI